MTDSENPKLQTQIDIKSIHLFQPRISTELTTEELLKEQRVAFPFFRRLSHRKESTWIISLLVILHLIAFAATMAVNDCWENSHGQCAFRQLGRFSFQQLAENPFLGPSASTLDNAGALRLTYLQHNRQLWRLFTSPCLHAGVFHLILSLSCVIFIGIHLEQEFGPLRIGVIYILSALNGSLLAALFLQDRPSVASSGALFGLLGATVSGLIQNWKDYNKKLASIMVLLIILILNVFIGLMPFVNNFSNIGGFVSGLVVSFMLLLKRRVEKVHRNKFGIFEYDVKSSSRPVRKLEFKLDLDKPVLTILSFIILSLLLAGAFVAILHGVNLNKYCAWCKYMDCVPFKWWSCSDKTMACETMMSSHELALTCSENGKFGVLPFANVSHARLQDLCDLICS